VQLTVHAFIHLIIRIGQTFTMYLNLSTHFAILIRSFRPINCVVYYTYVESTVDTVMIVDYRLSQYRLRFLPDKNVLPIGATIIL